jgi:glycosyltransferase involved in cell wall biosynthesis
MFRDPGSMELSVIICTYNRSISLKRTLESVTTSIVPNDLEWELLIVDNNSEDNTKEIVESFQGRYPFPIFYIKEEKQGLSYARNRGIRESRGRLIAFTDDDTLVDKNWIATIVKTFAEHDVQCIGGRILPIWAKPAPTWLSEELHDRLALLDYGDVPFYLIRPLIWGANLAVRTNVFEKYGLFSTDRGRLPNKLYSGEETHFLGRLLEGGGTVFYMPDATVYHCISAERMRKMYFRKWMFHHGQLYGLLLGDYPYSNFLGIPDYAVKKFRTDLAAFLRRLLTMNEKSFVYQLRVIESLGFMIGRLKYKLG